MTRQPTFSAPTRYANQAVVRIGDPLVAMLPAFAFFCLNLFIAISAL